MPPFAILSRYIGRQFLGWFLLLLFVLLTVVLLIDTVELLRRAAGKTNVPVTLVLRMGLLKLPGVGQKIIPFVVLFGAMFALWRLTRAHELVVARAVGVSVWQFLRPVLIGAFVIGIIKVAVINPIGAVFVGEYSRLEDRYLKGRQNALEVSQSGLWLRQTDGGEQFLLHADSVVAGKGEIRGVTAFMFRGDDAYIGRIDAPSAQLQDGFWELRDGTLRLPQKPAQPLPVKTIATELTLASLEEGFAPPDTISFWALPSFIRTLEATGFSAVRHRLHFQSLLAQPFLYCAMVLFAAVFSLRLTRRGGTLPMVACGIGAGFVVFVMTDVVLTLGVSGAVPVMMAAWTPAAISLLLGIAALLHLEDG